ncbi:hypothetical protein NUW58_g7199 [Xylaria curta]|uniref:Uncharacterized protein n=1 Tax=Xylaria curta TaxID=42375 RepID=A0ACC1NKV5_9PEZI|nr:hypothetical protein NUW58_g7199 [Xylaria curta]
MPKRSRQPRNVKRAPPLKDENHQNHLLALLDHCIKYKIKYDDTVSTYMEDVTGFKYDTKQWRTKVETIWDRWGRHGSKKQWIWHEGTQILSEMPNEQRQQIKQIQDEIELSSRRSRLRSASTKSSEYESPLSSLRSSPTDPYASAGLERQEEQGDTHILFLGLSGRPSPAKQPTLSFEISDTYASTEPEEDNKSSIRNEESQDSYTSQFRSIGVQHPDRGPDDLGPVSLLVAGEIERYNKLVAEKEATISGQKYRIFRLENELAAARKEYDKLLRRLDNPDDSPHNPKLLYSLQNTNLALSRQLQAIRAAHSNGLRIKSNNLGLTKSAICGNLDWLDDRIAKTCSVFGHSPLSAARPLSESSDRLQQLTLRVSGMSVQQLNGHAFSAGISDNQLMRSFISALVCELAFESSFPELLDSDSPLLRGYREQILVQGDCSGLESIDLLAHNLLFSGPYFESKLIPAKGQELSCEVAQLLAQWGCHATQSQAFSASGMPENELFQPIFERALTMKTQLLLSKTRYTLVFPAVGTEFNPATMRSQDWRYEDYSPHRSRPQLDAGEPPAPPEREGGLIKLCLFPALIERHVVNYRNFSAGDNESTTGAPARADNGHRRASGWPWDAGEWTSSTLRKHEGFEPMALYPLYTADFFDEKHNIVLGGSWATHPRIAGRKSFINWYQRNYPYAWVGARLVRDK